MLTISGKSLGSRKPLFADFSVAPPQQIEGDGGVTLRQLIETTVRHEVAAFKQRQSDRQFIRVLTESQIQQGATAGRIESGGSETLVQEVDEENAIANALQSFEDGIYLVSIDDQQCTDLDAQLFLQADSRVTFIRLTLLAGG